MSLEELDWDEDFDTVLKDEIKTKNKNNGNSALILSGVAANPDQEEIWDEDFELEESTSNKQKKNGKF